MQANNVFFNNIAMVIGPTPPGTGVINSDFLDTSSKATSPTNLNPLFLEESAKRVMPTSITVTFFLPYLLLEIQEFL